MRAGDASRCSREVCIEEEYAEDGGDLGAVQLALIFEKVLKDHGRCTLTYQAQELGRQGPNSLLSQHNAQHPGRSGCTARDCRPHRQDSGQILTMALAARSRDSLSCHTRRTHFPDV